MKEPNEKAQELSKLADILKRRNEGRATIKIVLIDGRELVRQGLRHILESEEDMEVVGNYASAEEGFSEMTRLHQDIILMGSGTQMPGMDWVEAVSNLKGGGLNHDADVIILAESSGYRAEALEAGAADYLVITNITDMGLTHSIRQIYRDKHSSKECKGLVQEAVELFVPAPADAACLLRFMCRLGEMFHDDFATIICTVGSWNRGTVVTVRPQTAVYSTLLFELANMPEVEQVAEEPLPRGGFSSFARKSGLLSGLVIGRRFRITLKETGMARTHSYAELA